MEIYTIRKIYNNEYYNIEVSDNKRKRSYLGYININGKVSSTNLDGSIDEESIKIIEAAVSEKERKEWYKL